MGAATLVAALGVSLPMALGGSGAAADTAVHRPDKASGSWKLAGSSATRSVGPLPVETGWGPTASEIATARRMVDKLSLPERAGQVIVAHYTGTRAPGALVNRLHLGGVIVFDENVTSADQVRRSNHDLQRAASRAGRRWPVLVGVDQEGGLVERVSRGVTRFPAFMTAGAAGDVRLTKAAYAGSAHELAGLGFTLDFAPDADVTSGPTDPTIGSRSAGSRPAVVASQARAASAGFASAGLVPVIKHFPGHGSVTANSHFTLPVQPKSLATLRAQDMVPFRAGARAGAPAVMVGHLDVRAVDPGVPASLSRKVVTGLLRQAVGFRGLAFTDALNMGAVTDHYDSAASAVHALRAGEDVLLMPPRPAVARAGIVAAVRDGRLSARRLDQAAIRQVALLLHQEHHGLAPRPPGSARGVSHRFSAAGITLAQGPCHGRLVGRRVSVTGPSGTVAAFDRAAAAAGLAVGPHGTSVRLVSYGGAPAVGDVVVAADTPYVLGRSRARVAKIATYGETPGAMRALVDVLLGRAKAPGHLPVPVPGVARTGC